MNFQTGNTCLPRQKKVDLTSSNNRNQAISCGCKFEKPSSSPQGYHWLARNFKKKPSGNQPRSKERYIYRSSCNLSKLWLASFSRKNIMKPSHCLHTTSPYGTVVAPPSLASSQHSRTPLELCELVVPPKRRYPKVYASGLDQQGLLLVQQMIQAIVQTSTLVDQQRKKGQWKRKKKDEKWNSKKRRNEAWKGYWISSILLSL